MRTARSAFIAIALLAAAAEAAPAQGALVRVGVAPLQVAGDPNRLGVLAGVVEKQLELTLRLLNRYNVRELAADAGSLADLPAYSKRVNVDNLLYGKVSEDGDSIRIELSAFDRLKGAVSLTHVETAASILDVFDATDRLISSVVEGFSNVRVAYGDIQIQNDGLPGAYRVTLNGVDTGTTADQVSRVLAGTYQMKIVQDRLDGAASLFDSTVAVKEGETTTVPISVPYLTEAETARFNSLDAYLFAHWYEEARKAEVQKKLDDAISAISSSKAGSLFQEYGTRYARLRKLLGAAAAGRVETAPVDTRTMPVVLAASAPTGSAAPAVSATPSAVTPSASDRGPDPLGIVLGGLRGIPYRQIHLSDGIDGWKGIDPVQVRPAGAPGAGTANHRVSRCFLARDLDNLYIGIEVQGGAPDRGNDPSWTTVGYEVVLAARVNGTDQKHVLQMYNYPGSGQWAVVHLGPARQKLEFTWECAHDGRFVAAAVSLDLFKDVPSGSPLRVEAHVAALLKSGAEQDLDVLSAEDPSRPLVFLK